MKVRAASATTCLLGLEVAHDGALRQLADRLDVADRQLRLLARVEYLHSSSQHEEVVKDMLGGIDALCSTSCPATRCQATTKDMLDDALCQLRLLALQPTVGCCQFATVCPLQSCRASLVELIAAQLSNGTRPLSPRISSTCYGAAVHAPSNCAVSLLGCYQIDWVICTAPGCASTCPAQSN